MDDTRKQENKQENNKPVAKLQWKPPIAGDRRSPGTADLRGPPISEDRRSPGTADFRGPPISEDRRSLGTADLRGPPISGDRRSPGTADAFFFVFSIQVLSE